MSKTKTLFTMALLVLLGSMGAAQAQDRFVVVEMVTQPAEAARAGGEAETSGSIWLSFSTADRRGRDYGHSQLLCPSCNGHTLDDGY